MRKAPFCKLIPLTIAIFVAVAAAFSGCAPEDASVNTVGNSAGNIINGGIAAQQGGWIYYIDDSVNSSVYKISTDGSGKIRLNTDKSSNLSVVGDWVYYANEDDYGRVYRMKTDGAERSRLLDGGFKNFFVADGWIYYQNYERQLFKAMLDGTGTVFIGENMAYFSVCGEWLFYTNVADGSKLYKMKTDGSGVMKLNNDQSRSILTDDNGKWIYYINENDSDRIYKVQATGYNRTYISEDRAGEINLSDDWIYYKNYNDSGKLYKMQTDGNGRAKLNDGVSTNINLAGGWIYYYSLTVDQSRIYRIRPDGKKLNLVGDAITPTQAQTP